MEGRLRFLSLSAKKIDAGILRMWGSMTKRGGGSSAPPPQSYTIGKRVCGGRLTRAFGAQEQEEPWTH